MDNFIYQTFIKLIDDYQDTSQYNELLLNYIYFYIQNFLSFNLSSFNNITIFFISPYIIPIYKDHSINISFDNSFIFNLRVSNWNLSLDGNSILLTVNTYKYEDLYNVIIDDTNNSYSEDIKIIWDRFDIFIPIALNSSSYSLLKGSFIIPKYNTFYLETIINKFHLS